MTCDRLTVVISAFNEAESLPLLQPRIAAVLDGLAADGVGGGVLYVDDGSSDATWEVMQRLAATDGRIGLLRLSRNFGKELALTAGLDRIDEGAALILDADGQDPPELIPQFVAKWREGYDDVHGTRLEREGEGWIKRSTAHAFYRVIGRLSKTPIPADTGDFRCCRHVAGGAEAIARASSFHERPVRLGRIQRVAIAYHREPRAAGRSKFNFWRLWNLALEGITSFSTAPLRLATYLGW
jgi:glycosyltransferase involved in cell wall biosynthesis